MPKSKDVEEKPHSEEELKNKIQNMAQIIEELSDNPSGSGDAEKAVESKMSEYDQKFGSQVQEIKGSLSELEKKIPKQTNLKGELEEKLKSLEEKIQPKFSELDEKLKALNKIEDIEKSIQALGTARSEKSAFNKATMDELDNLKTNVGSLSKSILDVKEQLRDLERLPILERKLQVESVLDPQDVRRLEKVVSAVEEMVPKKIVDEKLKLFLENSKEFQKQMLKQRESLSRDFINHVSKLEERVEIIFKLQKSYAEIIEKKIDDTFSDFQTYLQLNVDRLKNNQLSFVTKNELKELRNHMETLHKKNYSMLIDLEKNIERRALKGEMDRVKRDIQDNFDSHRTSIEELRTEVDFLKKNLTNKEWTKKKIDREVSDLRKLHYRMEDKLSKLEKKMDYQKSSILKEFKIMAEEKRRLDYIIKEQREKIGSILKKLVDK